MLDSARALVAEHAALEREMAEPAVASDPDRLREVTTRWAALGPTVAAHQAWRGACDDLDAARDLAAEDPAFTAELPALEDAARAAEER
ncbi:MAG: PCRF domain-containing protein, partial [Phycicoccus sp.]